VCSEKIITGRSAIVYYYQNYKEKSKPEEDTGKDVYSKLASIQMKRVLLLFFQITAALD